MNINISPTNFSKGICPKLGYRLKKRGERKGSKGQGGVTESRQRSCPKVEKK